MTAREALAKAKAMAVAEGRVIYVAPDPFGDVDDYCPCGGLTPYWGAKCHPDGKVEKTDEFHRAVKIERMVSVIERANGVNKEGEVQK